MPDNLNSEEEKLMKQIKRQIEHWREIILPLNSILIWERPWYPGLIIGINSTIFLSLWYLEARIFTTVSVILLIAALTDYIIPRSIPFFCPTENWTGRKEKKLDEICQNISIVVVKILNCYKQLMLVKRMRPHVFYIGITIFLLTLIRISTWINHLLFSYTMATFILMIPGLGRKGYFQIDVKNIYNYVTQRKVL